MKAFKDLTIKVVQREQTQFVSEVEKRLPIGWIRDHDAEARLNDLTTTNFSCFVCVDRNNLEPAMVSLVKTTSGDSLYVSNIVPREVSQLSKDEYNLILDDFACSCIKPVAKDLSLEVDLSSGNWNAASELSEGTYKSLISFSRGANRSTGTAHPMDRERWYDFVISVYRNADELDSSTLRRWMIEEESWPEDMAYTVSGEFEQLLGLLQRFGG